MKTLDDSKVYEYIFGLGIKNLKYNYDQKAFISFDKKATSMYIPIEMARKLTADALNIKFEGKRIL